MHADNMGENKMWANISLHTVKCHEFYCNAEVFYNDTCKQADISLKILELCVEFFIMNYFKEWKVLSDYANTPSEASPESLSVSVVVRSVNGQRLEEAVLFPPSVFFLLLPSFSSLPVGCWCLLGFLLCLSLDGLNVW